MESFYITLPCKFNKEALAWYNTDLSQSLNLSGSWDVGVSEVSFTKSWYNIESSGRVELLYFDPTATYGIQKSSIENSLVPKNIYTKESLIDTINEAIKLHFNENFLNKNKDILIESMPSINFNKKTNTFALCKGKTKFHSHGYIYLLPPSNVCELIGFDYQEILVDVQELFEKYLKFFNDNKNANGKLPAGMELPNDNINIVPRYPYNIDPIKNLYIMTDMCADRIFGSTRRNIIRIVEVPYDAKYGDQITISYDNPQYVPVRKTNFRSIYIKFRKEISFNKNLENSGEHYIKFNGGFACVTLHFKKISNTKIISIIESVGPSGKLADFEFIDASIAKITGQDSQGKIVPFSCNPLFYYGCHPIAPIMIKNEESTANLENDPNKNTKGNIKSVDNNFKFNDKWTHIYENVLQDENKRFDCFKIEIKEGDVIDNIKGAVENPKSNLLASQTYHDLDDNKKYKYECYMTDLLDTNANDNQKSKREISNGYSSEVGEINTREDDTLQKLTKEFCNISKKADSNLYIHTLRPKQDPTKNNVSLNTNTIKFNNKWTHYFHDQIDKNKRKDCFKIEIKENDVINNIEPAMNNPNSTFKFSTTGTEYVDDEHKTYKYECYETDISGTPNE
jgi:hypothetical protein